MIGEALISESHAVALKVGEKLREEGKLPTEKNITKATKEVLHRKADIAKLVAGSVAVLTGQDASIAISTATNAVENNLVVAVLPFILPEVYAILSATALGVANILAYQQNQKDLETLDAHLMESQEKQEGGAAQQTAHNSSGASGGMPNPDWEPGDHKSSTKNSSTKVERLADDVAQKLGVEKTAAKGDGYVIRIPNGNKSIDIRIMEKGGQRSEPYYRISIKDKSAVTRAGEFSSNPELTHLEVSANSLEEILKIVSKLKG